MQLGSATFHRPLPRTPGASDAAAVSPGAKTRDTGVDARGASPTTTGNQDEPGQSSRNTLGKEEPAAASRAEARKRVTQAEAAADLETVRRLAARDREVKAHEQAHVAAGGSYAGSARYSYERGPDGVYYAVGGEVSISTSEEATPEATLRKARIVRRAALAPQEPSAADRAVAAQATAMELRALNELAQQSPPSDEDKSSPTQTPGEASPSRTEAATERPETAPTAASAVDRGSPNPYALRPSAGQLFSRFA